MSSPDQLITWLHLSDLHAGSPAYDWDARQVTDALLADLDRLRKTHGVNPDFIFFTGDAAFGRPPGSSLADFDAQFDVAGDLLDDVRKLYGANFPLENIFLVPGNHDIDRSCIGAQDAEYLANPNRTLPDILTAISNSSKDWKSWASRLHSWRGFLERRGYHHLLSDPERFTFGTTRQLRSRKIGIAGLNSAWSCGRDSEKGQLWMGGRWQFEIPAIREATQNVDLSIALLHHPPGWLNEYESNEVEERLIQRFNFCLHGHEHREWVTRTSVGDRHHMRVAAGSLYASSQASNGYNLVQVNLSSGEAVVWQRSYHPREGMWGQGPVLEGKTDHYGRYELKFRDAEAIPQIECELTVMSQSDSDLGPAEARAILSFYEQVIKATHPEATFSFIEVRQGTRKIAFHSTHENFVTLRAHLLSPQAKFLAGYKILEFNTAGATARVNLGRLPNPIDHEVFVGRSEELRQLNEAWADEGVRIIQVSGDGGVGKSTLVWQWLRNLEAQGLPGVTQALDWSFYSQGVGRHIPNAHSFLEEALKHFAADGIHLTSEQRLQDVHVARTIAKVFLKVGGLIVLDGLEPLQYPLDQNNGQIRDTSLNAFLSTIRRLPRPAGSPRALVVITTRWAPLRAPAEDRTIKGLDLSKLSIEAGAVLLRKIRKGDKKLWVEESRTPEEQTADFLEASRIFEGHALALLLFSSYLFEHHAGNLAGIRQLPPLPSFPEDGPSRLTRRVLQAFDKKGISQSLKRAEHGNVLLMLGLFDRPTPRSWFQMLINGDSMFQMGEGVFDAAITDLGRQGLITVIPSGAEPLIDTHPIIREHYQAVLLNNYSAHARRAHFRIGSFLRGDRDGKPESNEEMELQLLAITHLCEAGCYATAFRKIYWDQLMAGPELYCIRKFGAIASVLSALAHFFEPGDWSRLRRDAASPEEELDESEKLTLYSHCGNFLMDMLGYGVTEVERCLGAGLELAIRHNDRTSLSLFHYRQWKFRFARVELLAAIDHQRALLALAQAPGATAHLFLARRTEASLAFMRAQFNTADARAQESFDLYRSASKDVCSGVPELGETMITVGAVRALSLVFLGRIGEAFDSAKTLLALTDEFPNLRDKALALCYQAWVLTVLGKAEEAIGVVEQALTVSEEGGFHFQIAGARGIQGLALIQKGEFAKGIQLAREAFVQWQMAGARLYEPHWMSRIAWAFIRLGQLDNAEAALADAFRRASVTREVWWEPELYRLRGELAEKRGENRVAGQFYRHAYQLAEFYASPFHKVRAACAMLKIAKRNPDPDSIQSAQGLVTSALGEFERPDQLPDAIEAQRMVAN